MTAEFVLYLGVGKLLIYLIHKFVSDNTKNNFINSLASCDLCLGTWIYVLIGIIYKINILSDIFQYVPILSGVITGCVASFVMHLLSIGWKEKFSVIVI